MDNIDKNISFYIVVFIVLFFVPLLAIFFYYSTLRRPIDFIDKVPVSEKNSDVIEYEMPEGMETKG